MADFVENCKKWTVYLKNMQLESIITDLMNLNIKHDDETNKHLFKLLLHLSHSADRCYRINLSKEVQIFTIAKEICENLISIPDKTKLYSALYYVSFYLLKKQYFKEAKQISCFLLPGKILTSNDCYKSSIYQQLASLWHSEIFQKLDTLTVNSKINEQSIDEEFCKYVEFHLQILNYCDESLHLTLKTADAYIIKLANVSATFAFPFWLIIFKHLLNYISNLKILSVTNAFGPIISMLGYAFYKRSDAINNPKILNYFRQCDFYFVESLKSLPVFYDCYRLFREYTLNLLETNFMSNEIGERFKKSFQVIDILIQKYGVQNKSLIETTIAISYSFEVHFSNWENLVSKQLANTKITCDNIVSLGVFIKRVNSILKNRLLPNSMCKKCPESINCPNTKDIYYAANVISTFLRVIVKFTSDNLDENVFLIAKELLDELVYLFNELDRTGCSYSSPIWDVCGRMIFNIGLISETKYSKHLEKLYEILCTQIILKDGINSKVSSFGLEDPVAVALNRLSNIYYNQENYRKAMSYTAYNALFSHSESRKKKANDRWANIKLKLKDSKEMHEITLINCLKADIEVVQKFGINVNFEDYDLNELRLRELKSLSQIKSNMMLSMKKTIDELESANSPYHYAQGVLQLSFHVLHFKKRGYISEYITKAINKLINLKSNTAKNQCLLANLNFCNIIEKFYARNQVISKQVEDANFTIKACRQLKGQLLHDEIVTEDEIVPTYGGINIEEDNRCAKELRDVLTIWENCMQKSSISDINSWEFKETLEMIIICGEYCRLYKFKNNEEKSWKLAYQLAANLQDLATCIYVTSRSISLRYINENWISQSENYVKTIKNSIKLNDTNTVGLFWLSLADFYLDCKKIEEAKELLEKFKSSNFNMLDNSKLYIYFVDIQFRNYSLLNTSTSQEKYCSLIVEMHYLLITLYDILDLEAYKPGYMRFHFLTIDQYFESLYHITIPMIGLVSYREISVHLANGLKCAQKLGMTLRIAQLLKQICYIDLLRTQVEDCEARLQDLEHILCLENFQASIKFKAEINTQDSGITPINYSKNSGSPELKRKMFSSPEFLIHTTYCQCFFCTNSDYQYMAFSCAHLRAHLYSMLKYVNEAENYFHGASNIKLRIDEKDSETKVHNKYEWNRNQKFMIDIMLYLLDLSIFISEFKPNLKENVLILMEEALQIGSKNNLSGHPVYFYASELYFQYHIYEKFQEKLCISVPLDIPIDITNQSIDKCVTPKQQIEKVVRNPRRHKSPVLVGIPVIEITEESDNENNPEHQPISKTTTISSSSSSGQPVRRVSARNVRRQLLVDELDTGSAEEEKPKPGRKKSARASNFKK